MEAHGIERAFGFVPMFRYADGRPQSALPLDRHLTLDCEALNTFVHTTMFLGNSTPFAEVKRVIPEPVIVRPQKMTRDEAIDRYIDLFTQAVARCCQTKTFIALSGGRDSRHILLELERQGAKPARAFTVAIPGRQRELEITQALAARVGVPLTVLKPSGWAVVTDEIWKNEHTHYMSFEHRWMAPAARIRPAGPWWDGIGGDVLSSGVFIDEELCALMEQAGFRECAERLVPYAPLPGVWGEINFSRDTAIEAVTHELKRHREAANPVGSFYFWNRTRGTVSALAFGLLRVKGEPILAPYLDRDLWEFLSSVPAALLVDQRLHTDAIARAYPKYSRFPYYENEKNPIKGTLFANSLALGAYALSQPRLWTIQFFSRLALAVADPKRMKGVEDLINQSVLANQLRGLCR